jgi:hypothetical protein
MTDTPFAVTAIQTAFYVVGVLFLIVGVRAGAVAIGSTRWMRRENINLPLVWTGVTIFAAGVVFALVAGIVWFSWFRVGASVITAGITGYLFWAINRLHQGIKSGAIRDYADELEDDEDDD